MSSLLLTFPMPPVLNEQLNMARYNKQSAAKEKKAWTGLIERQAREQNKHGLSFGKAWVVTEYCVRTRAYDPDGLEATKKFVFDGLQNAGVLRQDNLVVLQTPALECFRIMPELEKEDEFINMLLLSESPFPQELTFANIVEEYGPMDEDEEDADVC